MRQYRERLRTQGLRPIQIWVPDCRAPDFQNSIDRQIRQLDSANEREAIDFIDKVAEGPGS